MKIKLIALALIIGVVSGCDSSSDGSSENASVCFNDTLYQVGTKYTLATRKSGDPVDIESYEVMEVTQYRGQEAIRVYDSTGKSNSYMSVDNSNKSVTTLGYIDDYSGQKLETYYSPGLQIKFDLNAGESYEQTYTAIDNAPQNPVYDVAAKFIGIETITVPAGTYKACKFEEKSTITLSNGLKKAINFTVWFAVEHGVLVKMAGDDIDADLVLVEASINGEKI